MPDVLVSSADIGTGTAFWESDPDEFEYVLRVNLIGTFLVARAFTRRLLAIEPPGAIVNVASTSAYIPATGLSAYCASKGGVLMFTRVAPMELGARGIRVRRRARVDAHRHDDDGVHAADRGAGIPPPHADGRFGQHEDIAQAILYVASPLSAWVTGHLLVVDGGQGLRGLPLYLENLLAPSP